MVRQLAMTLRGAEPAECEEECAHCKAGDKYPGFGLSSGNGQT